MPHATGDRAVGIGGSETLVGLVARCTRLFGLAVVPTYVVHKVESSRIGREIYAANNRVLTVRSSRGWL
jgi:hypothetical protein